MYTPTHTFGSLVPTTSVSLSLHTFLGVSWLVLLPYTAFGAVLVLYSQALLMRGQRAMKRADRMEVLNATIVD